MMAESERNFDNRYIRYLPLVIGVMVNHRYEGVASAHLSPLRGGRYWLQERKA